MLLIADSKFLPLLFLTGTPLWSLLYSSFKIFYCHFQVNKFHSKLHLTKCFETLTFFSKKVFLFVLKCLFIYLSALSSLAVLRSLIFIAAHGHLGCYVNFLLWYVDLVLEQDQNLRPHIGSTEFSHHHQEFPNIFWYFLTNFNISIKEYFDSNLGMFNSFSQKERNIATRFSWHVYYMGKDVKMTSMGTGNDFMVNVA